MQPNYFAMPGTMPPITSVISTVVSSRFGVHPEDLTSRTRKREIVLPRQICMYLCERYLGLNQTIVGTRYGGFDHSTVNHSRKVVIRQYQTDKRFRTTMHELLDSIQPFANIRHEDRIKDILDELNEKILA